MSFTGLLHVRQVPCLNCLASQLPDHKDLAFKLKRKQFTIEVCCGGYSVSMARFLHEQNTVFTVSVLLQYLMLSLEYSLFHVLCPIISLQCICVACHVPETATEVRKPLHVFHRVCIIAVAIIVNGNKKYSFEVRFCHLVHLSARL